MLKDLLKYLENKRILILGYGKEGKSTYLFLRKSFPEKTLFIADKNKDILRNNPELIEDMYVEVSLGEEYLNGIEEYDLIIKAPGISFKGIDINNFKEKITSELELFLEFVNIKSIGITGTKGKSTTTTLMYKILKDQEYDAFLLGNIGEPIFNHIEEMNENSIAVIELSSHALEYVKKSPSIAILLDIYEEHLDHYDSLEKYIEAKFNVAKYQNENDYFIYNYNNTFIKEYNFKYKENDYAVFTEKTEENFFKNKVYIKNEYIYCNDKKIMNVNQEMKLKGIHNINNIMFIIAVANILNLDTDKLIETIREFNPLEHRMEFVAKINEVSYYNDSIATIPESTINAIEAIGNINTLIVGGKDRGINLTSLFEYLKNSDIPNIICIHKTGEYIYEELKTTNKKIYKTQDLQEAVRIAKKITKPGTNCIMSPAATSYGYFKNFEERGRLFKQYVKEDNIK